MTSGKKASETKIVKEDDEDNDNDLTRKRKLVYEKGADATLEFVNGESIRINKTLLAFESERFNDIFFGSTPCTNVKILDFDCDTFQTFLDCWFGLRKCSVLDALMIYPIAHKYDVKKCLRECVFVLKPIEMNENVCLTLNLASFYKDEPLLTAVIDFLINVVTEFKFLENKSYLDLLEPSAVFELIAKMKMNSLLLKTIYEWGENYVKKNNSEVNVPLLFKKNNILSQLSFKHFESIQSILDFHNLTQQELLDSKKIFSLIRENIIASKKLLPEKSCWVNIKKGVEITELIKFKHSYRVRQNYNIRSVIFHILLNKVGGHLISSNYLECKAEYIFKTTFSDKNNITY